MKRRVLTEDFSDGEKFLVLHKGSISQGQRESGYQEEDSASGSHFFYPQQQQQRQN
jgi:hypothetical protein